MSDNKFALLLNIDKIVYGIAQYNKLKEFKESLYELEKSIDELEKMIKVCKILSSYSKFNEIINDYKKLIIHILNSLDNDNVKQIKMLCLTIGINKKQLHKTLMEVIRDKEKKIEDLIKILKNLGVREIEVKVQKLHDKEDDILKLATYIKSLHDLIFNLNQQIQQKAKIIGYELLVKLSSGVQLANLTPSEFERIKKLYDEKSPLANLVEIRFRGEK